MNPKTATALAALGAPPRNPLMNTPAARPTMLSPAELVAAVVHEAGGQLPGNAERSASGVSGRAAAGAEHGDGQDFWSGIVSAVVAEAGAPNVGGRS